jgi:hypothetical protein
MRVVCDILNCIEPTRVKFQWQNFMLTMLTKLSSLEGDMLYVRLDRDRTLKVYFTISSTFCSVKFVSSLFAKICVIRIYYRARVGKSAL